MRSSRVFVISTAIRSVQLRSTVFRSASHFPIARFMKRVRASGQKVSGIGEYRAPRVRSESSSVLAKSLMPLEFLCADSSVMERGERGGPRNEGKGRSGIRGKY